MSQHNHRKPIASGSADTEADRFARKRARLKRLPSFVQNIVSNPKSAQAFLAAAPLTRMLIEAGLVPEPGFGPAQYDAAVAIIQDAVGITELSDGGFELAIRAMTPPEFRGREQ